jgi:Domain of unknown function (DUF6602)
MGESRSSGPVHDVVRLWDERLRLSLRESRTKFHHSGNLGEANEAAFRNFLRAHLPPKYRLGDGEVIDMAGRRSHQMDVIVADEEQPFEVKVNDPAQLMIIEGVSAAAEVKTTLKTTELRDCLEKGRSFKSLEAILGGSTTLAPTEIDGNPNSDLPRFYQHRPFFAFAYEGAIDIGTLGEMLSKEGYSPERDAVPALDAVFILDKGFAVNFWDANGALAFYSFETQKKITGWQWFGDPDRTLLGLLLWLNSVMPRFAIRSSPLLAYLFPGVTTWTPTTAQETEPM